jgi:hypothetical protein
MNQLSQPPQTLKSLVEYYNIPNLKLNVSVGVISLGGGLTGVPPNCNQMYEMPLYNPTNSSCDVQTTWYENGHSIDEMPKLIYYPIDDVINDLSDELTEENIADCTMVGCVPNPNLTIILFRFPASWTFYQVFQYIFINSFPFTKPKILSCSWGNPEIVYSNDELEKTNKLLESMSKSGFNICVASGDQGSTDGNGTTTLCVDFPSCCPYVIAVGGSNINPNDTESVWNMGVDNTNTLWASVGGYSSYYKTPQYQVQRNSNRYRSVPDVVMHAGNTEVNYYGKKTTDDGTSFSSPLFAGCMANIPNLNQFINPLIYSLPKKYFNKEIYGNNYSNQPSLPIIEPVTVNNLTIEVNEAAFSNYNIDTKSLNLNYSTNNILIIIDNHNENNSIIAGFNSYSRTILSVVFFELNGEFKMGSSLTSDFTIKVRLESKNTNTIPLYVSNPENSDFNQCIGLGSIKGNTFFKKMTKILNPPNYDQVLSGDVIIKKSRRIKEYQYKITFSKKKMGAVLEYQVFKTTTNNDHRKVRYQNAKSWVKKNFKQNNNNNDNTFKPTVVMELCLNNRDCRYIFVMTDAKIKHDKVIFYASLSPLQQSSSVKKTKLIIPTGQFKNARFDI